MERTAIAVVVPNARMRDNFWLDSVDDDDDDDEDDDDDNDDDDDGGDIDDMVEVLVWKYERWRNRLGCSQG